MTLTAIRPVFGLGKGREVSLWRVDQASSLIAAFAQNSFLVLPIVRRSPAYKPAYFGNACQFVHEGGDPGLFSQALTTQNWILWLPAV